MQQPLERASRRGTILLVLGILFIAANLRAPITSVAPVLQMIRASFDLTGVQAGMLTTLPLLAFAVVSPFSSALAKQCGIERVLFSGLVLIAVGILLRSLDMTWCLFVGTCIIGAGIALCNVLLPSLLKRDFPSKIGLLTGAYALTMGAAAAIGSAAAIPLAETHGLGWQVTMAMLVLYPLIAGLVWLPQLRHYTAPSALSGKERDTTSVWRAALAWQVTLYLGLNSFIYYVVIGWLPAILSDAGFSETYAGSLHGLLQLASALPGLLLVPLLGRLKDQKILAAGVALLAAIALTGFVVLPAWATLWTILFGLGSGGTFILGLAFISLRASHAQQAASLSGMAQCVGYLLAAIGPPLVGQMHDVMGGWIVPLTGCVLLALTMAVFGLFAGRSVHIA